MIALSVFLGGPPFAFRWNIGGLPALQVSFQLTPVALCGFLFGPLAALLAGAASDLIRAVLFPMGAYVPWFTIVFALMAAAPAFACKLFFRRAGERGYAYWQMTIGFLVAQFLFSTIANTLLISLLYGNAVALLLPTRIVSLAMAFAHALAVKLIAEALRRSRLMTPSTNR